MPVSVSCEICGDLFKVKPYRKDSAKYCSKVCQHKSLERDDVDIECDNCGEIFSVKPSRESTARFCSNQCYGEKKSETMKSEDSPGWKGGSKVTVNCEFCEKSFNVFESRLKRGVRFCSDECKYNFLSEEFSEPHAGIRNSAEYRKWRSNVKERDGCCVDCGNTDNLHAHHIIPVDENKDVATELSNGETLCQTCHAKKHPELANLIDPKS